jgi:acyl carrier protein
VTTDEVVQEIRQQIARRKQVPIDAVGVDQELIGGLGLDSLDYAAVVLGTEAAMGGELDESNVDWVRVRTVKDLAEALVEHVK